MEIMRTQLTLLTTFLLLSRMVLGQSIQPVAASVEMYNGRPVIMLNGKKEYPVIYSLTDVPGGRWSWEELPAYTMRSFCQQGFKLVQIDLFFDHVWKEDGSINIDTAQRQLRGVIQQCPDAAIFIRFHVNPPKWWQHKYPAENTVYADVPAKPDISWGVQRIIEDDEETPHRTSLASEKWLTEASHQLKKFLIQVQALPEAAAIAGIQVAGGVYGEWHYWGFINNEPDMSEPMRRYFSNWVKKKYKTDRELQRAWNDTKVSLNSISLPGLPDRQVKGIGIFRDPSRERKIIDYYEAQHDCVADDILLFCKLVKENWRRPIITGAFYGYFYAVFGREAAGGHLQLQKVLNSPYIDFLCGPGVYYPTAVETGDAYRSRSLIHSVLLHGKLWLDEMDQQPPLLPLKDSLFKTSLDKSIATVRRNTLFTYTQGMGLWFYDFGPSGFNGGKRLADHGSWGWWDEPSLMRDIGNLKKLMEQKLETPFHTDADVLLVHDTKSFFYTGSSKRETYMDHWTNNWIPPALFKSGAVHDAIHIDDLDRIDIKPYRVVVFANTWVMSEAQRKLIASKLARDGRHLVFLYAPGYSDGEHMDKKYIESVTGIRMTQLQSKAPTVVTVGDSIPGERSYQVWNNAIEPLFAVVDKQAVPLGKSKENDAVLFARKKHATHTSWYLALPPANFSFWRYLLHQAGAHIYSDRDDVIYSGGGILTYHSATGGVRTITLRKGTSIQVTLAPNSTTLFDSLTGKIIFE